ncbi:hypothetical protein ABZQ43_28210, partial [Pseudomonas aeruginosa]
MTRFSGVVIFQCFENCWFDCPARRSLIPLGEVFDRSTMEVPVAISTFDDSCAVLADMSNLNYEGRRQKLSATPDLSGTVLPLCLIPNSALKSAPPFKSVVPKASA